MVTFPSRTLILIGFVTFFVHQHLFGQVIFRSVPDYQIRTTDSLFFDISDTRSIIPLNGKWSVRPADDENAPATTVSVPSIFEGEGEFIFEKEFELTQKQITRNVIDLFFFSINYTTDISLNNIIIYRHSGGEYPFRIELPRDILLSDKKNLLSVKLSYKLDSKNTIPQKQRFLFPQNFGGITGDVFLHLKPDVYISKESIKKKFTDNFKSVSLEIGSLIKNARLSQFFDSDEPEFNLRTTLQNDSGEVLNKLPDYKFKLERNRDINISQNIKVTTPALWSPDNPMSYIISFELFVGDSLIDVNRKSIALYEITPDTASVKLNGSDFVFKGVTYYPENGIYGKLITYDQMQKDIELIKETGFNCIRFAKGTVHPYYLSICEKYGLLAFLEIPISGVPSAIAEDPSFINRSKDFLLNYISFYNEYSSFAAIGLGETYLPQFPAHISLISVLADLAREKSNLITYASFAGMDLRQIENLDFYGLEFIKQNAPGDDEAIKNLQNEYGKGKIIFSSATYPVNIGGSDGYVNDYSFEAQAKYNEEFLNYSYENNVPVFFINTIFDYRGDYASFICGFNKEKILYRLGLVDESRNKNRIGYKVVQAKLNNLEKVTIPIGSKKSDAPMVFIIFGLFLAVFMGALVNTGRKFREDASRALLRPYNFFSDIRDQRIISAYHTTLLGLIISAAVALVISNILFHLKTNLLFEHLMLSFGNPLLMKTVNYLAWNPVFSLLWLTLFNIVMFIVLAMIVKIASFFVTSRVYISGVYFTIIWALLPVILLIPVGIILYRVLLAGTINLYIYLGLFVVIIWILYRLMKGIHVLFDTKPGSVYMYSIFIIIAIIAVALFYFELKNSTLQYIMFTLKQFNIL